MGRCFGDIPNENLIILRCLLSLLCILKSNPAQYSTRHVSVRSCSHFQAMLTSVKQ
jgi:hypothetical protein